MKKFVLYLLGKKGFQVLKAAIDSGHKDQVSLVVVGKDHHVHEDFHEEIVKLCGHNGVVYCLRNDLLESSLPSCDHIAFVAGWRWLINTPYHQIIVFHDSLLPKYRGFNPLVSALLHMDSVIGVTAISANDEFDRGDIIGSRRLQIHYPIRISDAIDSVSELYNDLAQSLFEAFQEKSSLKGIPQKESDATYSVWRDDEDYKINWSLPAHKIVHFINCLSYPYKGASSTCNGKKIRILDAEIASDIQIVNRDAGKVLFINDGKPVVICGSGLLRIINATDDEGNNVLPFKKFRSRLK